MKRYKRKFNEGVIKKDKVGDYLFELSITGDSYLITVTRIDDGSFVESLEGKGFPQKAVKLFKLMKSDTSFYDMSSKTGK